MTCAAIYLLKDWLTEEWKHLVLQYRPTNLFEKTDMTQSGVRRWILYFSLDDENLVRKKLFTTMKDILTIDVLFLWS